MELRYCSIVLKKREVGETDRLYTLYTQEAGKVQAKAVGVRKQEAKLAAQLETLNYGYVMVVRGRGMGKIAGALAENTFPYFRTDLETLQKILATVAIFERLVDWEEKDKALFDLLLEYLILTNDLARAGEQHKILLHSEAFLIQLFAHLGYQIETGVCAVSGAKLTSGERYFFSPEAGGVVLAAHVRNGSQAFPIAENTIKLLRLVLANHLSSLTRIDASEKELRELRHAATSLYRWIRG